MRNKNVRSEQDTIEFDVLAHFLLAMLAVFVLY